VLHTGNSYNKWTLADDIFIVNGFFLMFLTVGIGRGMIMKKGAPLNLKKGLRGPGRGGKLLFGENRVREVHIVVIRF
jgi:hypothetical protein